MQYSGRFTITKKENTQFNLYLIQKKLLTTSLVIFLIVAVMVGFMSYAAKGMTVQGAIWQGVLMGLVGVALITAFTLLSMYVKINTMYKKKQLTEFSFDATVDKDGVHSRSERGDSDVPWNRIAQIVETKQAFYIVLSDQHTNVFPKAQIPAEKDMENLRAIFRKYMEPARLRLKG